MAEQAELGRETPRAAARPEPAPASPPSKSPRKGYVSRAPTPRGCPGSPGRQPRLRDVAMVPGFAPAPLDRSSLPSGSSGTGRLCLVGNLVVWPLPHGPVRLAPETVGTHSHAAPCPAHRCLSLCVSVPLGNPQARPGPAAPISEGMLPRRQGRRHLGPAISLEVQSRVTGIIGLPRLTEEQILHAGGLCQQRGQLAAEDRGRGASSISRPGPQFGERGEVGLSLTPCGCPAPPPMCHQNPAQRLTWPHSVGNSFKRSIFTSSSGAPRLWA